MGIAAENAELERDILERVESFRARLSSALRALPNNPNVIRISKNCAAVPMSQVMAGRMNLTAKYHLFEGVYDELAKIVEKSSPSQIRMLIEGIIYEGGTYKSYDDRKMVHVHPDAVAHIKTLWGSD